MGKVWFVGAGPGHPDLITVRGRDLIQNAGAILYAGSLVSTEQLAFARAECIVADSSGMTLDDMTQWLAQQAAHHEIVIRLQTGDPALYGALAETAYPLIQEGVEVGVIPGVSSAMASAAAAVESFTLPEVTQTVMFTRVEGRTPMPSGEQLQDLARHGTSLCLFLSASLLEKASEALLEAGWDPDAPILAVYRVSWPEERILYATTSTLSQALTEAGFSRQTMIIVSPTLGSRFSTEHPKSRLYAPDFTHGYRVGQEVKKER